MFELGGLVDSLCFRKATAGRRLGAPVPLAFLRLACTNSSHLQKCHILTLLFDGGVGGSGGGGLLRLVPGSRVPTWPIVVVESTARSEVSVV